MDAMSTAKSPRRKRSADGADLREHILATASSLFYQRGVRAVGVDLVIDQAEIAKTSLYRYFPTKDHLIVAFLEREDVDFWSVWDEVAARHGGKPMQELDAQMGWIGARLQRENYRGCPQINVAAEFAEHDHPARSVARLHMQTMQARLLEITRRLKVKQAEQLATQLAVLINGAFVSSDLLSQGDPAALLQHAVRALVGSSACA
jgi:AcrR family transcriptional regulator